MTARDVIANRHGDQEAAAIINDLKLAGFSIVHESEIHGATRERCAEVCDVLADREDVLAIDAGSDDLTPIYRRGEGIGREAAARVRALPDGGGGWVEH